MWVHLCPRTWPMPIGRRKSVRFYQPLFWAFLSKSSVLFAVSHSFTWCLGPSSGYLHSSDPPATYFYSIPWPSLPLSNTLSYQILPTYFILSSLTPIWPSPSTSHDDPITFSRLDWNIHTLLPKIESWALWTFELIFTYSWVHYMCALLLLGTSLRMNFLILSICLRIYGSHCS